MAPRAMKRVKPGLNGSTAPNHSTIAACWPDFAGSRTATRLPAQLRQMPDWKHPALWGRTLIVVAHPDDEALALGGHLRAVRPWVWHLTGGAPRNAPRPDQLLRTRAKEWEAVRRIAGIARRQVMGPTVADQETFLHLVPLVRQLVAYLDRIRPSLVLTHCYEGGHPDHDSAAFICQAAIARARQMPLLLEFPAYRNGAPHAGKVEWARGTFLPSAQETRHVTLSRAGRRVKQRMFAAYKSQRHFLEWLQPDPSVEVFRIAPGHNFQDPPHPGVLLYESFNWGIRGDHWRAHASGAAKRLADRPWP